MHRFDPAAIARLSATRSGQRRLQGLLRRRRPRDHGPQCVRSANKVGCSRTLRRAIQRVGLANVTSRASGPSGLVGSAKDTSTVRFFVTGVVQGDTQVGALAGRTFDNDFAGCHRRFVREATVTGAAERGQLVGLLQGALRRVILGQRADTLFGSKPSASPWWPRSSTARSLELQRAGRRKRSPCRPRPCSLSRLEFRHGLGFLGANDPPASAGSRLRLRFGPRQRRRRHARLQRRVFCRPEQDGARHLRLRQHRRDSAGDGPIDCQGSARKTRTRRREAVRRGAPDVDSDSDGKPNCNDPDSPVLIDSCASSSRWRTPARPTGSQTTSTARASTPTATERFQTGRFVDGSTQGYFDGAVT